MASRKNRNSSPARNLHEKTPQPKETESANDDVRKDEIMRYDPARTLLIECLERATNGDSGHFVENLAAKFTTDAKNGVYDDLTDDEYHIVLGRVEKLSVLWHNRPRRPAGEILLSLLEQVTIPRDGLEGIADTLVECYDWKDLPLDEHGNPKAGAGSESATETDAAVASAFELCRPAAIRDAIAARIIGQEDAAKAAAMVVHGQISGRRTNAVFCGPSGCGKSEIWRCLSKEYPGLIRMIDASRMSGEGWAGGVHLRNVFDGVNPDDIRRRGLIVVFDEADKILCERAVGASGTDHNRLVQNNMLKMLDGDVIEFGSESSSQPAFSVDCSNVSVVMLGAFENLLNDKTAGAKRIGFGTAPVAGDPGSHRDISYGDLIKAGTRREIAGRINRIIALNPLDAAAYESILTGPALEDLEKDFKRRVIISAAAAGMLSRQAIETGLGVRWAKSAMRNAVEDSLFDAPEAAEFRLDLNHGKLRCRAQASRETDTAGSCPESPADLPTPEEWFEITANLPF